MLCKHGLNMSHQKLLHECFHLDYIPIPQILKHLFFKKNKELR